MIHSFLGSFDGSWPQANLVADGAGNLYGTTLSGGSIGQGTVFELSPPATPGGSWTEIILHSFQGGATDGIEPYGTLIFDSAGNLHGTLLVGGVFEDVPSVDGGRNLGRDPLDPNDLSFHGSWHFGKLAIDDDGNLCGTTQFDGTVGCNCGLVFEVEKPRTSQGSWKYRVLYQFGVVANDGAQPGRDLLLLHGVLYGTTLTSLGSNQGTVFKLARKPGLWTETILYRFGAEASTPSGGLISDDVGNLYGVTSNPALQSVRNSLRAFASRIGWRYMASDNPLQFLRSCRWPFSHGQTVARQERQSLGKHLGVPLGDISQERHGIQIGTARRLGRSVELCHRARIQA